MRDCGISVTVVQKWGHAGQQADVARGIPAVAALLCLYLDLVPKNIVVAAKLALCSWKVLWSKCQTEHEEASTRLVVRLTTKSLPLVCSHFPARRRRLPNRPAHLRVPDDPGEAYPSTGLKIAPTLMWPPVCRTHRFAYKIGEAVGSRPQAQDILPSGHPSSRQTPLIRPDPGLDSPKPLIRQTHVDVTLGHEVYPMRTTTKMRTVRTRRRPRQPRLPRHGGLAIALPQQYATTLPPSLLLPHTPRPPANPIPPRRRAAGSCPAPLQARHGQPLAR